MTATGPAALPRPERALVMGVLNVTPDSFSDGGRWLDPAAAIRRGLEMAGEGADIVDVGGESTRPGADRVDEEEELRRVLPVIRGLADDGLFVTVDTMRAAVAEAALRAGARMVNDVSGGRADPRMPAVIADAGVPYVAMHWRGHSRAMQDRAVYGDVVHDVAAELRERVDSLTARGIDPDRIVLDPGIGFAKEAQHNWALLARLDRLAELGYPLLVGASRKAFLGRLLADSDGGQRPAAGRDDASLAVATLAADAGVWGIRTHRAGPTADAVAVAAARRAAR